MQSLEISILKTVAYFNVFSYPLNVDEIVFFLDQPATEKEIIPALFHLVKTKQLFQFSNFYSLRNEPHLITRRINGNELALKDIKKAKAVARFLSWMPFIKGIAISGSLSKNFADENSDLDFFIITAANRLWIVRMMYAFLFKIASTLKLKNWFCLNYFIDEADLKIKEQNIFTAIEVATLMPLKGEGVCKDFFQSNNWVYQFLPNYKPDFSYMKNKRPIIVKRITEWLLNATIANKLDDKLHAFFKERFERMTAQNIQSEKGLTIGAYEAGKHVCKPLPQYFQPKILNKFLEQFKISKERYYRFANDEYYISQQQ